MNELIDLRIRNNVLCKNKDESYIYETMAVRKIPIEVLWNCKI